MDKSEIETLFRTNYTEMYMLALRILKDSDDARDIIHDLFAELMENPLAAIPQKGYLLVSVRNRSLNHIRNLSRREQIKRLVSEENLSAVDSEEEKERMAAILDIIKNRLSPQCSGVMDLRFGKGMTYKEIAEALGISEVAVYKHLRKGISIIREHLKK